MTGKAPSQDAIEKVLGVQAEGLEYNKDWEKVIWPIIDNTLYGARRLESDADNFLRAAKMKPMWRMFQNLLFYIIFTRKEGNDNVSSKDRFMLYNLFLRVKINLPPLILNNWTEALKQKNFNKVPSAASIPYASIFAGILRMTNAEKNLNLNRLTLYAAGDEITRSTFNKMRIGAELFPLMRIKDEPVEVSSEPAEASALAPDAKVPQAVKGTIPSVPPAQTKPPHQARIKRPVSLSKRKPSIPSIIIRPQSSAQSSIPPPPSQKAQTQAKT